MDTFELWSYDVQGDLGKYAEHTYIRCPERDAYFDCWGNHASPTQGPGVRRFSCQGLYAVADCYRRNQLSVRDTAGLGVYGVNGVCHQSANLFLYSSGRTIAVADGVKGYAITSFAYGPYGDFGPTGAPSDSLFLSLWKTTVYNPCYEACGQTQALGSALFQAIKQLHSALAAEAVRLEPGELLRQEVALLVEQAVPGIEAGLFKDLHLDFLREKQRVLALGVKGMEAADKLNELAVQFQKALAARIGDGPYEKLTGLKAGETVNIIDPAIAGVV